MTYPSGTITFLFTDIEGSTKLAQGHPDKWDALQQRHHAILQSAMDAHNGYVFQIIGDAFCVAFHTASDGLHAAIETQRKLQSEDWGDTPVKVRMGIHTGEAELQSTGNYHGYLAMSRVQRLMSAGHGGQVLVSQATQELVRDDLPEDINLRDLGEKRLKDLIRPERIYQLDIADLPVDFPALKTLDKYRHNLPVQLTSFIGREKEMAEIKTALNEHRLITLTGSGGAGKTRLSLQVAADLLDSFPNGIWFVELAPVTDPDLISQTILSAADMQVQQGRSALDSLKDFLREKTSLVILDNCEHMIEACAKLADTLLHTAPNLKILASSREALGVRGEQAWHVPSLSIPDVKHLPAVEQLSQYEAVRLLIDRALLVQPHFAVTNDNAPAVAQICSRLDGIPLAIELAAARVKVLKPEQIAERLNNRFRLLTGGSRTALPRQQTLRALIDWSYDLLSENEQLLLRRLAVFSGGCMLEATEQVCSDDKVQADDILDLLTHLVDKSLVVIDEEPSQLRYHMLETVRQYAREKLFESGEGEKFHTRHLAYFLKLAEETEPHLFRKEQIEWLDRLELEHDNFQTALEWAKVSGGIKEGLRMATALWWFWNLRSYIEEGYEWLTQITQQGESSEELFKLCARALYRVVHLAFYKGESIRLIKTLLEKSWRLNQKISDSEGCAFTLGFLAWIPEDENKLEEAQALYKRALEFAKRSENHWLTPALLLNMAHPLYMDDQSVLYLEECIPQFRKLGDRWGMAWSLRNLATRAMAKNKFDQATGLLSESLLLFHELSYKVGIRAVVMTQANLAFLQKDYEQAVTLCEKNLILAREIGIKNEIVRGLLYLGIASLYLDSHLRSQTLITESLRLCDTYELTEKIPDNLMGMALVMAKIGMLEQAIQLFGAVDSLAPDILRNSPSFFRTLAEQVIESARTQLDEASFNAAWAEGRAMKIEDAIEYALKELEK